jgi:hypothetical protein
MSQKKGEAQMKKYILVLVVLSLIDWPAAWQHATQPKTEQGRVTNIIEIQTAEGPAYLVCVETTGNIASASTIINSEFKQPKTHASGFNLFPEPVTVALLACCGYLIGGRRR